MTKGFEFDALKALGSIVEKRSFATAAREMQVSRSALSEMIRKLEARLGVQLLNRTTRSVSPTEACINLLSRFEPAATEIDAALHSARLDVGRVSGAVRVHAQRFGYEMILRPAVTSFLGEHPDVKLDISLDDATIDIVAGGFDVGIRLGELLDQDVVGIAMGPELRQIAVASPAYLERHGSPTVPKDLLSHRCLTFRWPGRDAIYAWEFRQSDGAWFSIPVSGPLILNDQRAAIDAAVAGVGVAFWVESTLRPFIEAGQLVPLLSDWCGSFPGFSLYFPRGRHRSAAVQALIASLRRHFER